MDAEYHVDCGGDGDGGKGAAGVWTVGVQLLGGEEGCFGYDSEAVVDAAKMARKG